MSVAAAEESHWVSLTTAALAAVVVGYASTILIVMQAADAVGATAAQKISWAAILCFTMAGVTLFLSWRHKMPMIIAWSTPGAALIAQSGQGIGYNAALGAFALSGVLMVLTGLLKPLAKAIERMPTSVAAAMLAGVLFPYVSKVPAAALLTPYSIAPLIVVFFAVRLWKPLWAVPLVVVLGLVLSFPFGAVKDVPLNLELAHLTFDLPQFQWQALVSIGLPLYLVTMASQNLPGFAVLRAAGYQPPVQSALVVTGVVSALMSPTAGPSVNMAAITASLATGLDAHPDPAQRWKVTYPYFVLYVVVGLAAPVFVTLLSKMPPDLVHAVAGLALFGPLMGGMAAMMKEPQDIDAALVTFLVTASGFAFFNIGSAFWGLLAGLLIWGIKKLT